MKQKREFTDESPGSGGRYARNVLLSTFTLLFLVILLSTIFFLGGEATQATQTIQTTATTNSGPSATTQNTTATITQATKPSSTTLNPSAQNPTNAAINIRKQLIEQLTNRLTQAGLKVTVDQTSGSVNLASLTFISNSKTLSTASKSQLDQFIPVYLSVLFDKSWQDQVDLIMIEGYADDGGNYLTNLQLSQDRAYAVMAYLSAKNLDSYSGVTSTSRFFVVSGLSYSKPILVNGVIDKEKSRRVEFQFGLKSDNLVAQTQTAGGGN